MSVNGLRGPRPQLVSNMTSRPRFLLNHHFLSVVSQELNFHPCQMKTFFQMPFPVNFISKSIRTVPFSHQDYAR